MSQTKHTPGPRCTCDQYTPNRNWDGDHYRECEARDERDERDMLLAALEAIVADAELTAGDKAHRLAHIEKVARAAIARAKGETK